MELTPQKRGKQLEKALHDLFTAYGIAVRESFYLVGVEGEGIVEQVDGVVEISSVHYFIEMKWTRGPVGRPEISEHLVRLMGRAQAHGLFISASGFSAAAIGTCREFLQQKLIVLCDLEEIVMVLDRGRDLREFLIRKIQEATDQEGTVLQAVPGFDRMVGAAEETQVMTLIHRPDRHPPSGCTATTSSCGSRRRGVAGREAWREAPHWVVTPQLADTIECRDAIVTPDDIEPDCSEANFVIGNPPFLSGKLLITHRGEDVSQMFRTYAGRVPAEADRVGP